MESGRDISYKDVRLPCGFSPPNPPGIVCVVKDGQRGWRLGFYSQCLNILLILHLFWSRLLGRTPHYHVVFFVGYFYKDHSQNILSHHLQYKQSLPTKCVADDSLFLKVCRVMEEGSPTIYLLHGPVGTYFQFPLVLSIRCLLGYGIQLRSAFMYQRLKIQLHLHWENCLSMLALALNRKWSLSCCTKGIFKQGCGELDSGHWLQSGISRLNKINFKERN